MVQDSFTFFLWKKDISKNFCYIFQILKYFIRKKYEIHKI